MSNIKLKNNPELMEAIEKALNSGSSVRGAARDVLGSESRESSIRAAIKRGDIVRDSDTETQFNPLDGNVRILYFDIETAPLRGAVWSMWMNNLGLNQIETDWFILSYAARWSGDPEGEVMYEDLQGYVDQEDDSKLLDSLWKLLDEADVVIGQNSKKFDAKKINARFIMNGYTPPSSYKHIDTLQMAKSSFAFTSNKLEYMSDKLCTKYKKLTHQSFAGYKLWAECLKDNPEAWAEMRLYNEYDVLSLEELYLKLAPWDKKHVNFNLFNEGTDVVCRCGSTDIVEYGFAYTGTSKFQRYRCRDCGAESRGRTNLFDKEKRKSLHMNIA